VVRTFAASGPLQAKGSHQTLDGAPGHRCSLPVEVQPHLAGTVDAVVALVRDRDLNQQVLVPCGPEAESAVAPEYVDGAIGQPWTPSVAATTPDPGQPPARTFTILPSVRSR